MSNENSTVNRPLKLKSANKSGRSRKFSCITYLNETQLKVCLMRHSNQIRVYAYAYHDKDTNEDGTLKEPHYHLLIVTHCAHTISAIRRWFGGYVDSKGMDITTTAQRCNDIYSSFDYLTHNTAECKAEGKYQYDKSIVRSNDFQYFTADEESEYDNITLAAMYLMLGVQPEDCAKKFGREFILNYGRIKQYVNDVMLNRKYDMKFEAVLDREYEKETIDLEYEKYVLNKGK